MFVRTLSRIFREISACDYRSLALLRILISTIIICDLFLRSSDLFIHYTNYGVVPANTMQRLGTEYSISIHFFLGTLFFQKLLMLFFMGSAFSLFIGYKTTLNTFICWFLLTSLHNRNTILQNGGDDFIRLILFWSMFLPLGKKFSVDSALKQHCKSFQAGKNYIKSSQNDKVKVSLASFAIKLQICWLYFEGYYLKTGKSWTEGLGLYYALKDEEFTTRLGLLVLEYSPISLLKFLSNSALIMELVLPMLILCPLYFTINPKGLVKWSITNISQSIAFLLIASLHAGIFSMMEIGFFPSIPIASSTCLIPSSFWDLIQNRIIKNHIPQHSNNDNQDNNNNNISNNDGDTDNSNDFDYIQGELQSINNKQEKKLILITKSHNSYLTIFLYIFRTFLLLDQYRESSPLVQITSYDEIYSLKDDLLKHDLPIIEKKFEERTNLILISNSNCDTDKEALYRFFNYSTFFTLFSIIPLLSSFVPRNYILRAKIVIAKFAFFIITIPILFIIGTFFAQFLLLAILLSIIISLFISYTKLFDQKVEIMINSILNITANQFPQYNTPSDAYLTLRFNSNRRKKIKYLKLFICGIALLYLMYWASIPYFGYQIPFWGYFQWIAPTVRIEQKWTLFAPDSPTYTHWLSVIVNLADGRKVDIFGDYCSQIPFGTNHYSLSSWLWNGGGGIGFIDTYIYGPLIGSTLDCSETFVSPPTLDKPTSIISKSFKNERWRKYFMNLKYPGVKDFNVYYCDFICKEWNLFSQKTHKEEYRQKATRVQFICHKQMIEAPGEEPNIPSPLELVSCDCLH